MPAPHQDTSLSLSAVSYTANFQSPSGARGVANLRLRLARIAAAKNFWQEATQLQQQLTACIAHID
jgi:hypothetical protein